MAKVKVKRGKERYVLELSKKEAILLRSLLCWTGDNPLDNLYSKLMRNHAISNGKGPGDWKIEDDTLLFIPPAN